MKPFNGVTVEQGKARQPGWPREIGSRTSAQTVAQESSTAAQATISN